MRYFLGLLVMTTLVAVAMSFTPFSKCSKATGGVLPVSCRITVPKNCTKPPCAAPAGKEVAGEMDFIAPYDVARLKPHATATAKIIFNPTITIDVPQENGCDTLIKGSCPLKKGDKATYAFTMPVNSVFSLGKGKEADVEFSFLDPDQNDRVVVCAKIPAVIT